MAGNGTWTDAKELGCATFAGDGSVAEVRAHTEFGKTKAVAEVAKNKLYF